MKKNSESLFDILKSRLPIETNNMIYIQQRNSRLFENQGTRNVINRYSIPPTEVKASQWFDDIWLYLKVEIKHEDQIDVPFISICFFQDLNDELNPLFRAEWDNYPSQEGYNHPQPHWHITNINVKDLSFDQLKELPTQSEAAGDFAELLDEGQPPLNIYKMHFSMAGNWISSGAMPIQYIDNNQIANWISFLLIHVKSEIEYIKE